MAPAVRKSAAQGGKSQSSLRVFGKVSKVSKLATSALNLKAQAKKVIEPVQVLTPIQPYAGKNAKRRRGDDSDADEEDSVNPQTPLRDTRVKKAKLQLTTPPPSSRSASEGNVSPTTLPSLHTLRLASTPKPNVTHARPSTPEELPQTLQNIISMHEVFLKALSIHYAHNGPAAPAELTSLLTTVTCLWKKHRVSKEDIQRMLALYEISEDDNVMERMPIEHKAGPFKLTTSGLRTCIEYVAGSSSPGTQGLMRTPFNEKCLQMLFRADLMSLFLTSRCNPVLHFLSGPLGDFPLLSCSVGAQTIARKETASARLSEILSLSAHAQQRSKPKAREAVCDEAEVQTETQVAEKVKSRTLSLFERVRAKQLANASVTTPTAEAILRRHAIGRIAEVVEILRMKQQQKMSASFHSSIHDSPSKARSKVSFSFGQLMQEIRNSVTVPIAEAEVSMCLKMLAGAVTGSWISTYEMGSGERTITSVVLNGAGMGGLEVQRALEERERNL